MECLICLRNWDSTYCVPKSLSCGHSFCMDCLGDLIKQKGDTFFCPFCQAKHKINLKELDDLPKNFSLLTLAQEKREYEQLQPISSSLIKAPIPPSILRFQLEKMEKMISINPYCENHQLLLHSYIPGCNKAFCDKCLTELPPSVSGNKPIPKVCRDLKYQIHQAKSQVSYNKIVVKRYKQVIRSLFDSNKRDTEAKISEYFQKINEILKECEQQVREQYQNMLKYQQQTLYQFNLHLDELFENLNNYEKEIGNISDYDDSEIVFITKTINEIVNKINIHNINVPNGRLIIDFQPVPRLYETLQGVCKSGAKICMLPLALNDQTISFKEYALPADSWLCSFCELLNIDSNIQCFNCSSIRCKESYPNLILRPKEANDFEKKQIQLRRQLEQSLVCARDLLTIEVAGTDRCWYLIDFEWLNQWRAFIFNKPISSSAISPNIEVGVLPPGPISNNNFFMKDYKNLKKGLKKNIDYRGVNEYVWEIYHRFYGGGPVLARNSLDIYSENAPNSRYLSLNKTPFYRKFEESNQELLELLVKQKKMESDEQSRAERDEISNRIRIIVEKNKSEQSFSEVVNPPDSERPGVIKRIFSFFH